MVLGDCKNPVGGNNLPPAGSITAFSFDNLPLASDAVIIDPEAETISVRVPFGTDITNLIPAIKVLAGTSINPASGAVQDFSSPVRYTVTTAKGDTEIWTVTVTVLGLSSVDDISAWLSSASGGGDADHPIPLSVTLSLGMDGWAGLLSVLQTANKYVELDLSACAIDGMTPTPGEFDPLTADSSGKGLVVSLLLPDTAASLKRGITDNYGRLLNASFHGFANLKNIKGAHITTLGWHVFNGCTSLVTADFPLVTTIGSDINNGSSWGVFSGCTSLETVDFPLATTISNHAFYNCTSLETVDFPLAATIGSSAFEGCTSLETVDFPLAATIDSSAFEDCTSLETVDFPLAATIGSSAFEGCTSLETVDFPLAATIGGNAFEGCASFETVNFPKAVTIGYEAFYKCTSLETVNFPLAATISSGAFSGCASLETVNFPLATAIGGDTNNGVIYGAFSGCTSLKMADISRADFIGAATFNSCTALDSVIFPASPPSWGGSIFSNTNIGAGAGTTLTIHVPTVAAYTAASPSGWGVSADTAASGNTFAYGNNHKRIVITTL